MKMLRLARDDKGAAGHLATVIERVEAFSRQHQGDPRSLVETIWTGFATRDPGLLVVVALDDLDTIVGHAVGQMTKWSGEYVGFVLQVEMDLYGTLRQEFLGELDRWAAQWNDLCTRTGRSDMIVREYKMATPHAPKAMERLGGFTLDLYLMRRPVLPPGGRTT